MTRRALRLAAWPLTVRGPVAAHVAALAIIAWLGAQAATAVPDRATAYGPDAIATQQAALDRIASQPVAVQLGQALPTPLPIVTACELPAWTPATVTRWRELICAAAVTHGVDPALLAIVVTVESGGDPDAASAAGAVGLTQVVGRLHAPGVDLTDPATALDVGARVLADCLRRYGRPASADPDWRMTVDAAAGCYVGGGPTSTDPQNRAYRRWITGAWAERHDATSPTLAAWVAAGGARLLAAGEE